MYYPEDFLKQLQSQHIQTKWAKITILNWDEEPMREIEGQITGGNNNVDGNSAIRTTISLSMISKTDDLTKYSIALRSKVRIDIGLENKISKEYPNIIWFKQGIFIVTNFNTSKNINQSSLNLSGKDKGCLLNGEISGVLPVTTDFGKVDEYSNIYEPITNFTYQPGVFYYKHKDYFLIDYSQKRRSNTQYYKKISSVTTTDLPIKDIIRNIVHIYGHEPWHKIIINDLDIKGSQLLEYRGETPLYLIKEGQINNNVFLGMTFDGDFKIGDVAINSLAENQYLSLSAIDDNNSQNVKPLEQDGKNYYIIKIKYGDTMGYKGTELTYPGNLIGNVGETVVTVLDKIKNVLGNFEYFYDVDGNFVFQAKHTYENVSFTKIKTDGENEVYIDGSFYNNNIIYSFNDEELTTSFNHTPNITNLKNDFSIWGEGITASGAKKPIHLRYALQSKPIEYTTIGDGERAGITYAAGANPDPRFEQAFALLTSKDQAVASKEEEIKIIANQYESQVISVKTDLAKITSNLALKEFALAIPEALNEFIQKIQNKGNTSWFTNFQNQYQSLLTSFNTNLNKINQICFSKMQDNPSDLLQNISAQTLQSQEVIITNQIPRPLNTPIEYGGIKFLWEKMFNSNELSNSAKNYLNNFSRNHNEACYSGYEEANKYYTALLKDWTEKFNQACADINLLQAWEACFNILQINIYLLYFYVFGHIERKLKAQEEEENSSSDKEYEYTKTGIAYNFGFNNNDYWEFYKQAKKLTQIFDSNLYLSNVEINTEFLQWLILIQNLIDQYNNYISQLEDCAQDISDFTSRYYEDLLSFKRDNCYNNRENPIYVDWRELIYQMARDYFDYYQNPKYNYIELMQNANGAILQKDGSTGYEVFYSDILGFWRELYYNPLLEKIEYDISSVVGSRDSYYDISKEDNYGYNPHTGWWFMVTNYPSSLRFWFDLTEGYDELAKYTISQIGDRLKATKDNAIKALYYKDVPNIVYYEASDIPLLENNGYNSYTYFQIGGPLLDAYTISAQNKTAIDLLQDQLYKFAFCVENISITTLPIYTLKPNYRVLLKSQIPGLSGEYIVSKYSIPLTYNGTMQITATKAVPYIGING